MNPPVNQCRCPSHAPADPSEKDSGSGECLDWHRKSDCVVIGLGTPNGDDQFGWKVVDTLLKAGLNVPLVKVQNPIDILEWLETAQQIHIVDAAHDMPDTDSYLELNFSSQADRNRIMEVPECGTHGLNLYSTLMLARSLGRSTNRITLWLGRAEQFEPLTDLSPKTGQSLQACLQALRQRLGDA